MRMSSEPDAERIVLMRCRLSAVMMMQKVPALSSKNGRVFAVQVCEISSWHAGCEAVSSGTVCLVWIRHMNDVP